MKKFLLIIIAFISLNTFSQTKKMTLDDAVLDYYKGLYPKYLRNLQWIKNSDKFIYNKDGKILINDANNNKVGEISLQDLQSDFPDLKRFPYVETITPEYLMFTQGNNKILFDYNNKKSEKISYPEQAENEDFNYKQKALAYTIDNNLYVATTSEPKIAVTSNDDKNIVSGQAIARSEFGITKGTFWSPSGKKLAFYQKDESQVENYPLVDVTVTPAKLHNIKYPMNGRGSEEPAVGVFDLHSGKVVYLDLFKKAGKNHYATNLTWDSNEKYIYLAEINRDQNHLWFNKYNALNGRFVKTLFEEKNKKWVQPLHPGFFIPNGKNEFIWMSQRDGFWNLYKYNTEGKLIKQLTHNKWVTKDVLGFTRKGKYVLISGTGPDARQTHLYRVNTRNGKIKEITPETGTHYILLSNDGKYYLDYYSSVDVPGKIFLGDTKAKKQKNIFTAENPLKDYDIPKPELFTIKGENHTDLYARMFKPTDFDPNKKYPVLVYVYNGPNVQLITNSWLAGASLWMPWFAQNKKYIVFTVDGHGSDNRGFDFESVIFRHLGQVEMKDQIHGVDYLKSLPYVDGDRIAVHGWSYGGFMTCSLMTTYPDVFKVGVAGGPVTDWKWYEVMYGERYMDTPDKNPEGFKETSVLNKIQNLKGKLLTIHGYQDDVVVPQHDIALHREAIKKGIQMDFYLYPTAKHNVRGKDRAHLMKKVLEYILQYNK